MKKKLCQITSALALGLFVMGLNSCESTPDSGAAKPSAVGGDHKPSYDYWQNGGGACCPAHAHLF